MSSFFPFSSSSTSVNTITPAVSDDPHLEVTVTPCSSAFYAGETFTVNISLRNTRIPSEDARLPDTPGTIPSTADVGTATSAFRGMPRLDPRIADGHEIPGRKGLVGKAPSQALKAPLPTQLSKLDGVDQNGYPYSPGANTLHRAGWPKDGDVVIRSPETWRRNQGDGMGGPKGHGRRTRSWALGNNGMSPQEMVWALGGDATPPPLPARRPPGASQIPSSHPHSRKISITTPILPQVDGSRPTSPSELPSIPESYTRNAEAGPSRPTSRNTHTPYSSASSSRSRLPLDESANGSRVSGETTRPRRPPRTPLGQSHSRMPSYQNAYGASFVSTPPPPPPPTHPYSRSRQPTEPRGTTTVLWAYTRLVGLFHPSNQYIPPDPLLPLRSLLLHQPVGSGSLMSPVNSPSSPNTGQGTPSRWQLSFGTGTIGHSSHPSLTGSLFGLAKDLVTGGTGGTLEEERRRVWQMKDLPVLETARSLLGVDIKLKEGETKEFTYTLELPKNLPPAHRGKAFRFSYDLVLSLTVSLPGQGNRQKSKDIHVPIRVWANVSLAKPLRHYDVLKPVIQTKDEAKVESVSEVDANIPSMRHRRSSAGERGRLNVGDTVESLRTYASHLLETADLNQESSARTSPLTAPSSPSRIHARANVLPPNGSVPRRSNDSTRPKSDKLQVPNGHTSGSKPRQGSILKGDDEWVAEVTEDGGCGQAVEVLSRHSTKTSYDIAKDGEIVAVLTLVKTAFRLGETVLGVVSFNESSASRRVVKVSAFLESHELIPEPLLPLSASSSGRAKQPPLTRLHAESRSAYTINTSRLSFSLDIPSDSTPDFSITAGDDSAKGGIQWKLRIAFLVSSPNRKHHHHHTHGSEPPVHVLPLPDRSNNPDNSLFAASTSLAPLVPVLEDGKQVAWEEMKLETVECEVPIKVLAGNTAFVVRPTTHII